MNLDHIITGNYGHSHPDNDLCPDCGRDGDHHCPECEACGTETVEDCERCAERDLYDPPICRGCGSELDDETGFDPATDADCPLCGINSPTEKETV